MEPERALTDLVEISPQIEAALVFDDGGAVAGAVGVASGREPLLAGAARELVQAAGEFRHGASRVTQLRASLGASDVFVVGGASGERGMVAVTSGRPAPGLVFYDLKRCLGALEQGEG